VLVPMSREAFVAFAAEAKEAYAEDHVLAGNWPKVEALAKAAAQFDELLPQGIDTPDHFLYEVRDASGRGVGSLWFGVVGAGPARAGYVFNIRIRPEEQRKGHGRAALLALEAVAAAMRLPALRLNVFGHNPGAAALYRSLGYRVTSSSMRKPLGEGARTGDD
jgi:ribosomal protein S18 acetylase RimI-like enzyme